jgi:hypothetical protein
MRPESSSVYYCIGSVQQGSSGLVRDGDMLLKYNVGGISTKYKNIQKYVSFVMFV